jgi:hypothetical protein
MNDEDRDLIRAAYLAVKAAQSCLAAVGKKLLPGSPHEFTLDGKLIGDL